MADGHQEVRSETKDRRMMEISIPLTRQRVLPLLAVVVSMTVGHASAEATELSGCWRGSWQSCTSGHQGPLKARFRRLNDCQYEVEFRGRFFKIFPFRYAVTLEVVADDGETVYLAGSEDLGRLFGVFHYQARATACEFRASYTSCKDEGEFVMRRSCCSRRR